MPTKPTVNQRLILAAEELGDKVEALSADVKNVKGDETKRRVQFVILSLAVLLVLVLSGGMFVTLDKVASTQKIIRENSVTLYEKCLSDNAKATKQLALWEGIVELSAKNPNQEPSPPEVTLAFNELLADTFKIEDCEHLKKRADSQASR